MRSSMLIVIFYVIGTATSKPLWSTLIDDNYMHPTFNAQPHYLATYQDTHSPYYVYNVHMNTGGIPSTIYANGKPEAALPSYSFYYGTPIYDFRIPLSPVYPVLTPSHHPGFPPRPLLPPTSTQEPFDVDDYDGIEKLDTQVDPNAETKKPENNEDDDSITVEAI
ncbi:hypothetical protein DMN91_007887 [Ooceraea biroi]|uniref:DUF4794 domain-containing protein n=1 Tax=Ooceraea biroi TaxID=2015173 RepID=A0A026WCP8_OOCBI|nr:uncharacterized protein LOC105280745 [Ooceraea biroi]EZA53708.1 hypothetical protein X777_06815 [Ooceraea biroi]RLU19330.1 hypothetical protein DMN91_007887 [Ooceraea biroi]